MAELPDHQLTAAEYQDATLTELRRVFGEEWVEKEWAMGRHASDGFEDREAYAPRLDISVGPWNVETDVDAAVREIKQMDNHPFLRGLGIPNINRNCNPRCTLGIEIEFSWNGKYILGGITNACVLGRVGILIVRDEDHGRLYRLHDYLNWLTQKKKLEEGMFGNLVTLTATEFFRIL